MTTLPPTTIPDSYTGRCADGLYPASYAADAPCVTTDPCIDGTTLWTVTPCTVALIGEPVVITATTVPPPTTSSLVATIANAPTLTCDGRTVYLALGGMVWHDGIGWRYRNTSSPRIHDIWNPTLIQAFDARASS